MVKDKGLHLVTALGNSEDLVLELLDFFNGQETLDYPESTMEVRKEFKGLFVSKVHLFCTRFKKTQDTLSALKSHIKKEFSEVEVVPVQLPMEDISDSEHDQEMRQEVEKCFADLPWDRTIISSAGRKTLTQRISESAMLHGCLGYLAIIGPDRVKRHEYSRLSAIWTPSSQFLREHWQRSKNLNEGSMGSGFRSLSVLPLMVQKLLQKQKTGAPSSSKEDDLAWLRRLPKADLHCHLGGCQDERLLQDLARQLLKDFEVRPGKQKEIEQEICSRLNLKDMSEISPSSLRALTPERPPLHCLQNLNVLFEGLPENEYLLSAVFVAGLDLRQIVELSRDGRLDDNNRVKWPKQSSDSLRWYMACGDLGGSRMLQSENTLRMALDRLMQDCLDENVRYLEVRCSPENYTRAGLLTINRAMSCLLDEADSFMKKHPGFKVNFIIMATRHKTRADLAAHVAAAVLFSHVDQSQEARVVGFDLAGQEEDYDPELFQDDFMPLHRHFLNITIHAGEMADEDKIWQAIYLLHAKRIGHGLKLINNSKMMDFVRDYGLALEMCPSSNYQTNGFRNFLIDENHNDNTYPLKSYIDKGIEVTINTDNRFISDTTLSEEYLHAASMTDGGLSRWEILKLLKSSFQAAFLPKDEKDSLLKEVDDEVFKILVADYFSTDAGGQPVKN